MTEKEWLRSTDAGYLMTHFARQFSDRKLHYYAIACCRRIESLLPDPRSLLGIDVLEKYIEGTASADDVSDASWQVEAAAYRIERLKWHDDIPIDNRAEEIPMKAHARQHEPWNIDDRTTREAKELHTSAAYFVDGTVSIEPWERRSHEWHEMNRNRSFQFVPFLRDIFGNPFRPVAFSPAWRTSTAIGIASQMYDSRDFGAMPILADALQDACCEDDAILSHCRDEKGVHVRGCWVVDLVLNKS